MEQKEIPIDKPISEMPIMFGVVDINSNIFIDLPGLQFVEHIDI